MITSTHDYIHKQNATDLSSKMVHERKETDE